MVTMRCEIVNVTFQRWPVIDVGRSEILQIFDQNKNTREKKNAVFLDAVKNAKLAVTQTTPRKLRIRVRCELSATHSSSYPE